MPPPPPWVDVLVSWFPFERPEKEIASILEKYGELKPARFSGGWVCRTYYWNSDFPDGRNEGHSEVPDYWQLPC